ncbi:hypothetical protein VTI28DRAFT_1699 [Corynascus sepedonium]
MLEGVTRATALVTLTSQEEAKKACEEGVVWRAQMLNFKVRGAAREAYFFQPRTFELALQQQQQEQPLPRIRNASFQGVPTLEEADDGFQEAGRRKRPRVDPPALP